MAVFHIDTEAPEETYMALNDDVLTPIEAKTAKELFHTMIAGHLLGEVNQAE